MEIRTQYPFGGLLTKLQPTKRKNEIVLIRCMSVFLFPPANCSLNSTSYSLKHFYLIFFSFEDQYVSCFMEMRLLMNVRPCFLFLVRFSSFFSIPWVHSLISIESTENIFPRSCSKQSMTPLGSRKLQQVWHFLLLTFASVGERIEGKKKHEVWRKWWYPGERKPCILIVF